MCSTRIIKSIMSMQPESFQPTDSILLQVDWWKTVTPGEHRLVVIAGKETFYVPFEIYDPKAETSPTVSQ